MKNIKNIIDKINRKPLEPRKAYDIWSETYDTESDNLVFKLEEEILDSLFKKTDLSGKLVLDYGCGTGRNWERLLSFHPENITGCDISPKMLEQLNSKYPAFDAYLIKKISSLPFKSGSFNFILSTLVIAQVNNLEEVFREWSRILKPGGKILLTDLHPAILSAGGKRTFEKDGRTYEVKNYIHPIEEIKNLCRKLNMDVAGFEERLISENSKGFYGGKNALHIYERFSGMPLVYGMLIEKQDEIIKS